ncbi:MAG: DUF547 domain-containing protein, partial [Bacteroidota bacterium]|nr:DUF547 domain-containing protein [Bacteroidota bacterium]
MNSTEVSPVELSRDILFALREGRDTGSLFHTLEGISWKYFYEALQTDAQKKSFWINMYNAFVQKLLKEHREFVSAWGLPFSKRLLRIAGRKFSLD